MGEFQFAVLTWQGSLPIAAAAAKVRAPRRFAMAVGYRLVPSALVEPLAWSVAGVEVILGAGLISGWHPTIMLRLAVALFVSFGLAMASALLRGRRPSCGCGVGEGRRVSWLLGARTGGLAIFAGLSSAISPPLGLQVLWRATSGLSRDAALATLIALLLLGMTWRALTVGLGMHNRLQALRR